MVDENKINLHEMFCILNCIKSRNFGEFYGRSNSLEHNNCIGKKCLKAN